MHYYITTTPDGEKKFIASSEKIGNDIGVSEAEWSAAQAAERATLDARLMAERAATRPIRLYKFRKMLRNKTLSNGVTLLAELEAKHADEMLSVDAFEYIEMSDPVRATDPEMDEIASALNIPRNTLNQYLAEIDD